MEYFVNLLIAALDINCGLDLTPQQVCNSEVFGGLVESGLRR